MPKPEVIDLSHHNVIPRSLIPAKEFGIVGVIHKATEGSTYVDSKLVARHHLAKDAGMAWGCYHFLNEKSSGEKQAKFFVETLDKLDVIDDDTLLAADHEDSDVSLQMLAAFVHKVYDLVGYYPVLYSGHLLKEQLAGYVGEDIQLKLWLAQYGPAPKLPNGFSDYWLWQYTDTGAVPGIDGFVDLNESRLTVKELLDNWAK